MAATRRVTVKQCLCVCILSVLFVGSHCLNTACIEVKRVYTEKGGNENEVPIQAISGDHLQVCSQGETCCTPDMEEKLRSLSAKEHDQLLDDAFRPVKSTFSSRTRKFNEFFTELLKNAKKELHQMFVKTYGLLYQKNAHVFSELFIDLQNYYEGTDLSLTGALDRFFRNLLRKMFALLNPNGTFGESYLSCVTNQMNQLKPFGDVPQKLSLQIKRSFVAARTFVQGLAIGRDVILEVLKIPPTESCTRGLMKMTYCPLCRGLTQTKPCSNYCLNTMKGCLAHHAELNPLWNEYIEAMKQLAVRLEGPFNIESVMDPIDVQISDAVMTLQENGYNVSEKIFKGCGRPQSSQLGRMKREAAASPKAAVGGDKAAAEPQADSKANSPRQRETTGTSSFLDLQKQFGDKIGGIPWDPSKMPMNRPRGTGHGTNKEYEYGRYDRPRKKKQRGQSNTAAGTSLDSLVKDIKEKIKLAKDFWVQLPYAVCNDDEFAASAGVDEDCWNGQDRARYEPGVQKDGIINQINNPEVEVDVNTANYIIEQQKIRLQVITNRLSTAFNGEDVEWIDDTAIDRGYSSEEGSGNGMSGDGSDEVEGSADGSGLESGSGSGNDGWDGDDDEERPGKGFNPNIKHRNKNKHKDKNNNDHYFTNPGKPTSPDDKEYNVGIGDNNGYNGPRDTTIKPGSGAVPQSSVSWTCLTLVMAITFKIFLHKWI